MITVYIVVSLLRHMQTEQEGLWIRNAFKSYVSPNLVDEMISQPDRLQLGGERRELGFVFTNHAARFPTTLGPIPPCAP